MADMRIDNQKSARSSARRVALACVALTLLGAIFLGLANWQLNRAEQRREIAKQIESGRAQAPVDLNVHTDYESLKPWQAARVTGRWLSQWSVLLDNRNLDGKPGFWLGTLLEFAPNQTVFVLRGWVPRPIGSYNPFPVVSQSTAPVVIQGEIATHVPRLYQISDKSDKIPASVVTKEGQKILLDLAHVAQRQNVTDAELKKVTGLQVVPIVLLQTNDSDGQRLKRRWPEPSVDADKNIGYAMQWASFAAIAFGAVGILLWRNRRRAKISN